MKKRMLFILTAFLLLIGVFYINATDASYKKEIGGAHQLKDVAVGTNGDNEMELEIETAHAMGGKTEPVVEVLKGDEPIFRGERKNVDDSFGEYIVQLTFVDTWLQENIKTTIENINFDLKDKKGLINKVEVVYPPDDSMMIIYIGCNEFPKVNIVETSKSIKIKLK